MLFPLKPLALVRTLVGPVAGLNFRAISRAYGLTKIETLVLERLFDGLYYREIAPLVLRNESQTRGIGSRVWKKFGVDSKDDSIRLLKRL